MRNKSRKTSRNNRKLKENSTNMYITAFLSQEQRTEYFSSLNICNIHRIHQQTATGTLKSLNLHISDAFRKGSGA